MSGAVGPQLGVHFLPFDKPPFVCVCLHIFERVICSTLLSSSERSQQRYLAVAPRYLSDVFFWCRTGGIFWKEKNTDRHTWVILFECPIDYSTLLDWTSIGRPVSRF